MNLPRRLAADCLIVFCLFPFAVAGEDEEVLEAPPARITADRVELIETAPMKVDMTIAIEAKGLTVGEGRDVFEHDGETYTVVSEARTAGFARILKRIDERRESRGRVTEDGVRPESFRQERTGKAPKAALFDWHARKLRLTEGDETEVVDLPERTLDQTSLPYAFVFAAPPRDGSFRVHVTDGRRLTEYDVAFVGQEKIRSRLGDVDALHYRKIQHGDDKRGFEFWLSLDHYRLPVRIRVVEKDGTAIDSNVTRIRFTKR